MSSLVACQSCGGQRRAGENPSRSRKGLKTTYKEDDVACSTFSSSGELEENQPAMVTVQECGQDAT